MTLRTPPFKALLLLFVFLPLTVWGQDESVMIHSEDRLQFEHLTREDGLPSNIITAIFQDSRGMMWFGTADGLVQYDGYNFKVYKNTPNDPQSLPENRVIAIYEDRSGTIWVGTTNGLGRFDLSTETFKSYKHDPETPLSLSQNNVRAIYEDLLGQLWIGTYAGGLNLMDREKETFVHYLPDPDRSDGYVSNAITGITEDDTQAGILWLGRMTKSNISTKFDTKSRTFIFIPGPVREKPPANRIVKSLFKSNTGEIWMGTNKGLDLLNPAKEERKNYRHLPDDSTSLGGNVVEAIFKDGVNTLWVATRKGGISQLLPGANSFQRYRHDPFFPKSLASDNVSAIYEDFSGILWIGTFNAGISYSDRKARIFKHLRTYDPGKKDAARAYGVSAICQDHNDLVWVGTNYKGLLYYDEKTKAFQHFKDEPGELRLLSKLAVWSIMEDRQDILWIGGNQSGLHRYDRKAGKLKTYKNDPEDANSLASNYVSGTLESQSGAFWVISSVGLQQLDRETGTFKTLDITEGGAVGRQPIYIYEDRLQNLWLSTNTSLLCLDPQGRIIRQFPIDPDDHKGLSSMVYSINEDVLGNIWLGSQTGLFKLELAATGDLANRVIPIKQYTEKDGLPSNLIRGILTDSSGQLWISTLNGFSLFRNPQHDNQSLPDFKNYDISDGLQAYEFSSGASFKNTEGELFFGGPGGLNRFHPDSLQRSTYLPPVIITSVTTFDVDAPALGAIPVKGISDKKALSLSYKNNIFSIEFAALSYWEGHKNEYTYQMEGFNNNWIPLGTEHQVAFTNLDPGNYTFRVKAANNDGLWNDTPTELKITITPPWWKTPWAYALYILAFMFGLYSWRNYELNRRQLKHDLEIRRIAAEKMQELDQLKSRFFANISHEFRTPLTLILGPINKLITNSKRKEDTHLLGLMERNAQRLQRLINQLLDISKLEAGKMKLEARQQDIVPVIKRMFYAFESLADHKGIRQKFAPSTDTAPLYFDADKIEHVIVNVLSNAFKFTPQGGTVAVTIKEVVAKEGSPFLQVEIVDDGSGIPADQLPHIFDRFYQGHDQYATEEQGSGIGLALTKELVELHRGEVKVSSELGEGTVVTILLPIGKKHLEAEEIVEGAGKRPSSVSENNFQAIDEVELLLKSATSLSSLMPAGREKNTAASIVLLVEDNLDMRTFLRDQLAENYQVVEATDGQEGLKMALETIPDLIISDVMMPRMDGLELCDALKNDERTSHIPIILLTAKADLESRLNGLERGADTYLAKPFNQRELNVHSHNLLESRRLLHARYTVPETPAPVEDEVVKIEDAFMQKVREIVTKHLNDDDFDMERFAHLAGMSRSQLFRKIKALTGSSPSRFIRSVRLLRAKKLLATTEMNVKEVAYEVGFSSPTFFSDAFLEFFEIRPSEVRNGKE